ncbi:hypothetical protein HPSSW140_1226 [Glaesserella parasuis SW140]|nr:hypothetical protein HPSSW140_1226 [Glaesserella parasuis SW140]
MSEILPLTKEKKAPNWCFRLMTNHILDGLNIVGWVLTHQ